MTIPASDQQENIVNSFETQTDLNTALKQEIIVELANPMQPKTRRKLYTTRPRGKNIVNCPHCPYKAEINSVLKKHMDAVHLGMRPFHCDICEFSCSKKTNLHQHIKTVHLKLKPFQCTECDYKTARKSHLKIHIANKHMMLFPYQCDVNECLKKFKERTEFIRHQKLAHSIGKLDKCPYCEFETGNMNVLRSHSFEIHGTKLPYVCDMCDYSSVKDKDVYKHKRHQHSETDKKVKKTTKKRKAKKEKDEEINCVKCFNFSSTSKKEMQDHMVQEHCLFFQCKQCDYKCYDKVEMRIHLAKEHAKGKTSLKVKSSMYSCKICGLKTDCIEDLKLHIKDNHKPHLGKPFICSICDFKTGFEELLEKHLAENH